MLSLQTLQAGRNSRMSRHCHARVTDDEVVARSCVAARDRYDRLIARDKLRIAKVVAGQDPDAS